MVMMGSGQVDQPKIFYEFSLDRHVPQDHLLRSIDRFVDLSELRRELSGFYSHTCRPSVDPELMLRLLVEEYARMGWDLDALVGLFRDPFYVAAHGLWLHFGEEELKQRLVAMLGRVGIVRTKTTTIAPPSERLVQIDLSTVAKGRADHD